MTRVTLSSSVFNNKSALITLDAIDGNIYNLGTQTLPYDYVSNMVYGTYSLFFAVSGITCQIVIPPVCDLKYDVIIVTPPPTPSPTPIPIFERTVRNDSSFENFYQTNVFDSFSGPLTVNLSSYTKPTRIIITQNNVVLLDTGYYGDESLYGINGSIRSSYVSNSLNGKLDYVSGFLYPNVLTSESESDGYPIVKNFTSINEIVVKPLGGPISIFIYSMGYYTSDNNYDLYVNLF